MLKHSWVSLVVVGAVVMALLIGMGHSACEADEGLIGTSVWAGLRTNPVAASTRLGLMSESITGNFQQVPAMTARIKVGAQTLMPYVGAGFGGGYASDRDRALNTDFSISGNSLLGGSGPTGFLPNEVQMGIRFPF